MTVVEGLRDLPGLLAAPRAVAVVSVPWSPWPRRSREALAALERTRGDWSPSAEVAFFDLRPEAGAGLGRWYEAWVAQHAARFELHGHGYGPLWWLAGGAVLGCLAKPYDRPPADLERRSAALFGG